MSLRIVWFCAAGAADFLKSTIWLSSNLQSQAIKKSIRFGLGDFSWFYLLRCGWSRRLSDNIFFKT
jgi:hypothetical protein